MQTMILTYADPKAFQSAYDACVKLFGWRHETFFGNDWSAVQWDAVRIIYAPAE